MRNPDRIDRVLNTLSKVWKKYPDLRLGQLIINVIPEDRIYYTEDDILEAEINKRYNIEEWFWYDIIWLYRR